MTYTTPLFSQMNNEGVDLNTAFTFYTTGGLTGWQEYPSTPLTLGHVVDGTLNGEWVMCTAAAAITKYDVVTISKAFAATDLPTLATSSFGLPVGIAMATATTGQALWIQTNGVSPGCNVYGVLSANALAYTAPVAGQLSANSSAGFVRIQGIVLTTASTSTGTGFGAILITPSVATAN